VSKKKKTRVSMSFSDYCVRDFETPKEWKLNRSDNDQQMVCGVLPSPTGALFLVIDNVYLFLCSKTEVLQCLELPAQGHTMRWFTTDRLPLLHSLSRLNV
jgi:hypothetical protein